MTSKDKYCGSCRAAKPKTEFNKHTISRDGLRNYCRTCQKKYASQYRAAHPKTPEQLAKQRAYNHEYRARRRDQINIRRQAARIEQKRIDAIRIAFTDSFAVVRTTLAGSA